MLLSFSNHKLAYGSRIVLPNITLRINAGEKVALVGPSGAGKSTLLNALYHQVAEQAALCPQDYGLVGILSVYNNIYMGQLERHSALYNLWNLIRPIPSHRQLVANLAAELGLEGLLDRSVDSLSGGQRQRVALGRAMYRQQATFFGDEPVSSLDPLQGKLILQSVLSRHQTAVVALHNRHLALEVFDRVIGIKDGAIIIDCPVSELEPQQLEGFYAR
ncbi:MAG: ATP-binding cassette domain-containing protein [Pseudomonadales bacterium]